MWWVNIFLCIYIRNIPLNIAIMIILTQWESIFVPLHGLKLRHFLFHYSLPGSSAFWNSCSNNSSHMLGPNEVTPDNQDNSISFTIPSSRENLNQFYDHATFTLINSAGSAISVSGCVYLAFYHSIQGTHDIQDTTYNIQDEPVTVTLRILRHWGLY